MNPTWTAVEAAIVGRLAPLRTAGLVVHALPEQPKEYGDLLQASDAGILTLVCFDDTPEEGSANPKVQTYRRRAIIYGRVRGLRAEGDLLPLQQEINDYLLGYAPPGCGMIRAVDGFRFLGRTDQDWEFQIGFQFNYTYRG